MQRCLASAEYATMAELRNVLVHRGTPPRQHFLRTCGSDTPSAIPSNLAHLASDWRYDFHHLAAECLEPYTTWLEQSVRALVIDAEAFTARRLQRGENAPA
jgi:hypothetical protein